jgi:hypothetical protein
MQRLTILHHRQLPQSRPRIGIILKLVNLLRSTKTYNRMRERPITLRSLQNRPRKLNWETRAALREEKLKGVPLRIRDGVRWRGGRGSVHDHAHRSRGLDLRRISLARSLARRASLAGGFGLVAFDSAAAAGDAACFDAG